MVYEQRNLKLRMTKSELKTYMGHVERADVTAELKGVKENASS